jgi:hypothetical protein
MLGNSRSIPMEGQQNSRPVGLFVECQQLYNNTLLMLMLLLQHDDDDDTE